MIKGELAGVEPQAVAPADVHHHAALRIDADVSVGGRRQLRRTRAAGGLADEAPGLRGLGPAALGDAARAPNTEPPAIAALRASQDRSATALRDHARELESVSKDPVARAWAKLAPATRALHRVPRAIRPFAAGMLWGWLPCGMAYAMLLLAAASGDALAGAARMAAFAAGTMPALALSAGLFGAATGWRRRPWQRRAAGAVLLLAGALLLPVAPWAPGGVQADHGAHAMHHHG